MTIWSPLGSGTTVFIAQFEQENQVRYLRIRSFSKDFSLFFFFFLPCLKISPSQIIVFIDLTIISSSNVSAYKNHVTLRLSFVNVLGLNKLLRSEIFISEDRQL